MGAKQGVAAAHSLGVSYGPVPSYTSVQWPSGALSHLYVGFLHVIWHSVSLGPPVFVPSGLHVPDSLSHTYAGRHCGAASQSFSVLKVPVPSVTGLHWPGAAQLYVVLMQPPWHAARVEPLLVGVLSRRHWPCVALQV